MLDLKHDQVFQALHALLQHLSTRVPDKAEQRGYVCDAVVAILETFPPTERARYVKFLERLSKNVKVRLVIYQIVDFLLKPNLRVFAIDLACKILCTIDSFASSKV